MRKRWQGIGIGIILAVAVGWAGAAFAQDFEEMQWEEGLESAPGISDAPAAAPTPAAPAGQVSYRLHRVGKEENLHLLAAYYYGDARLWTKIYTLNKKKIRNPNLIHEGQILKIDVAADWKPKFSLEEFKEKDRKRAVEISTPAEDKPKIIRETEQVQLIPRLEPLEEEEEEKGAKGNKPIDQAREAAETGGGEAPPENAGEAPPEAPAQ